MKIEEKPMKTYFTIYVDTDYRPQHNIHPDVSAQNWLS